jgi:hypothetical protein
MRHKRAFVIFLRYLQSELSNETGRAPGTGLRLNPRVHENLSSLGFWAVVLLSTVSMFCVAAAIGLWRTSRLGVLAGSRVDRN